MKDASEKIDTPEATLIFKTMDAIPTLRYRGHVYTKNDLPTGFARWTSKNKELVVMAVNTKLITADEACSRYSLSPEELGLWLRRYWDGGRPALGTLFALRRGDAA